MKATTEPVAVAADTTPAADNTADFDRWLAAAQTATETRLGETLSAVHPPPLAAAMQDAVLSGGKRLRPAMVFAAAGAASAGEMDGKPLAAACAVELIHCYSLVHDDLPCMDNAEQRRGRPACHRAHGEAVALLAGDCLQSLAFAAAAEVSAEAVSLLAAAAGAAGMGGGQALDIGGGFEDEAQLAEMCRLKTGALFTAAVQLGLLCRPNTTAEEAAAAENFAKHFGLLFQIANDIAGKKTDAAAGKKTYATLYPQRVTTRAVAAQQAAADALGGHFPRLAQLAAAVYAPR